MGGGASETVKYVRTTFKSNWVGVVNLIIVG